MHMYLYIYKNVKKKIKINAKLEYVGLTDDYGNKKWSLNFHYKPKKKIKILHTSFFLFLI